MVFFGRGRNPGHRRRGRARLLRCEPLERRELLSINVVGDQVQLLGSSGSDYAEVRWVELPRDERIRLDGYYHVELNGEIETFLEDEIASVIFRGYAGDDEFYNDSDLPSEADGGSGRDTLQGGSREDLLVGGYGLDHLYGGPGTDTLYARLRPEESMFATMVHHDYSTADLDDHEEVDETLVYDWITMPGPDVLRVYDYLDGGLGDDTLYGGPFNDRLWGGGGTDELFGYGGEDRLYGGEGVDTLHGGDDDDLLAGEDGFDRLFGEQGADRLFGGEDVDHLYGGPGDDVLLGEGGNDQLVGGPNDDHLMGGPGGDTLHGGEGNDGLFGGVDSDRDELWGDEPSDVRGDDRFLIYSTTVCDVFQDVRFLDVEVRFSEGTNVWHDREVYRVDVGLAKLQERAGTTAILEDTLGDRPIEFFQMSPRDLRDDAVGLNDPWQDGRGVWHREISLRGWDEDAWLDGVGEGRPHTVIHEMAHNWDMTEEEAAHPAGFTYWSEFLDLHRRSDFSDGSSDFARAYGQRNPGEDWATCWEATFGYRLMYPESPSLLLEAKLAIVDEFFAQFRAWRTGIHEVAVAWRAAETGDDLWAIIDQSPLLGLYPDAEDTLAKAKETGLLPGDSMPSDEKQLNPSDADQVQVSPLIYPLSDLAAVGDPVLCAESLPSRDLASVLTLLLIEESNANGIFADEKLLDSIMADL